MLRKMYVALGAILILGTAARAEIWNIDKAHTHVGFSVKHLVISNVLGEFTDFAGKVDYDGKNMESAVVDVTIQMTSVNTQNPDRDKHLQSPDFFDAAKFATMTFKSKKIVKISDTKFTMIGDLTVKGVTKEVSFDCIFNGKITDPWGNERAGFSAAATINRQDFGVSWSNKLVDGSLVVGNDVAISLNVELVKAK